MATLRVKVSTIDKESRYNTASDGPYTPATLSSAATPVGFFRKKKKENRCPPGKRRRLKEAPTEFDTCTCLSLPSFSHDSPIKNENITLTGSRHLEEHVPAIIVIDGASISHHPKS